MQMTWTVGTSGGAPPRDVVVEAPDGATAADLIPLLADQTGEANGTELRLLVGGRVVNSAALVGYPPLLDGSSVTLARELAPPPAPWSGALAVAVVAGPDSGQRIPLAAGSVTVGRAPGCDLTVDDLDLSRTHCRIALGPSGPQIQDLGSTNGTTVDGVSLGSAPHQLTTSSVVRIGSTRVRLVANITDRAATRARGDGTVLVSRRPRHPMALPDREIRMPDPPAHPPSPGSRGWLSSCHCRCP